MHRSCAFGRKLVRGDAKARGSAPAGVRAPPGGTRRRQVSSNSFPLRGAHLEETTLAKPNYSFEKRQRELAKKKKQEQKQEQKRLQRLANKSGTTVPATDLPTTPAETTTE
jgi:hypothetical protein